MARWVAHFARGRMLPRAGPYDDGMEGKGKGGKGGKDVGPVIVGAGLVLVVVGALISVGGLAWFGHLPGDIRIESDSTRVYFPLASMLVVSLLLSGLITIARRFFG